MWMLMLLAALLVVAALVTRRFRRIPTVVSATLGVAAAMLALVALIGLLEARLLARLSARGATWWVVGLVSTSAGLPLLIPAAVIGLLVRGRVIARTWSSWVWPLAAFGGASLAWLPAAGVMSRLLDGADLTAQVVSAIATYTVAFAVRAIFEPCGEYVAPARHQGARYRLLGVALMLIISVGVVPPVSRWWSRQTARPAELNFDGKVMVRGMVRDRDPNQPPAGNLKMTWGGQGSATGFSLAAKPVGSREAQGAEWHEVDGASVRELWQSQQVADAVRWPGHWVDPKTGDLIPFRFYRAEAGKGQPPRFVRVAGAEVLCGPNGEVVFDISLRGGETWTCPDGTKVKALDAVKANLADPNRPYTGGAEPRQTVTAKGLLWN